MTNETKPDYRLVNTLLVYFADMKALNLLDLNISVYELTLKSFKLKEFDEKLLDPKLLSQPERAAMVALDLSFEVYKDECRASKPPKVPDQQDFQHVWLKSISGHKTYEKAVQLCISKTPAVYTLEDLKKI